MATKKCTRCGTVKPLQEFCISKLYLSGYLGSCKACKAAAQRLSRSKLSNHYTRKYEKTKRGFLMRAYRNMKSRISGVQSIKFHLYAGKYLLPKDQFYEWAINNPSFHSLFDTWEGSDFARNLTPSVDRIDSSGGYEISNMEWVTHSINSRRGAMSRFGISA